MKRIPLFDIDSYVLYENANDSNALYAVANQDNEAMLQAIGEFQSKMSELPDHHVVPAYKVIVVKRPNKFEEHIDIETNIASEVKVNVLKGTWIKLNR